VIDPSLDRVAATPSTAQAPLYLDYAATTPVDPRVADAMAVYQSAAYGNPSSMYRFARDTRRALDAARDRVADLLGARSAEIVFTAGGSESDNFALKGVAFAHRLTGHIITTQIEHHAVLNSAEFLEKFGVRVTYVAPDVTGTIDPDAIGRAIADDTILVSVMHANNEIGTIQPIEAISRITRARRIPLHVDAVQTAGVLDLSVDRLGVDLLSVSGHKFYGPKGVGVLYVRRGTVCWPLIHGGGQERGRRAGTENVAAIVGLAAALDFARAEQSDTTPRLTRLRDRIIDEIGRSLPRVHVTGHPTHRLPNLASFCFEDISGESLLLALDQRGIMVSTGSACTSGSLEPSHVLQAIGLSERLSRGSLRVTVGNRTSDDDVTRFVHHELRTIVERLRSTGAPTAAAAPKTMAGETVDGADDSRVA
jgi:cysteine desulfurase